MGLPWVSLGSPRLQVCAATLGPSTGANRKTLPSGKGGKFCTASNEKPTIQATARSKP